MMDDLRYNNDFCVCLKFKISNFIHMHMETGTKKFVQMGSGAIRVQEIHVWSGHKIQG